MKPLLSLVLLAVSAAAQTPIKLNIDAMDATRRLFHATMQFPVKPGPFSLLYPKWIPGEHGPTGPVTDLVNLRMSVSGKPVQWKRDPQNMFEFHVEIPAGASTLDVTFDFISPPEAGGFSSGGSFSAQLGVLSWNQMLLYPRGLPSDQIQLQATLQVPIGWRYGTALPIESESGNTVIFKPAALTTMVDSPVQMGAYYKTIDLAPGEAVKHYLHIAADSERATRIPDDVTKQYRNLIREATSLFGASHYRSYHFLYTLSDHVAHFGLEHHESSDDRTDEQALVDEDTRRLSASLLPHEFVHSWNGKFRRPKGLATPDYSQPMEGELLWVYEGLTNYLGEILTPRSGLSSVQDYLDELALNAAALDRSEGRKWRPLSDTGVAAQSLYEARADYGDLRRGVDFYPEGSLIWLEADVTIRTLSKGAKSLDDFAKLWGAGSNSGPEVKPYTVDDVVRLLNSVQLYDWAKFFNDRVYTATSGAPLGGITGSGYKLVYKPERSSYWKNLEGVRKGANFMYSIGLRVRDTGEIGDVKTGSPAALRGVAPAQKIIAVNGREFSTTLLRHAIEDSAKGPQPIVLLIKDGEFYSVHTLDYHGGEQYPWLERDTTKPDLLSDIIRPHVAAAK